MPLHPQSEQVLRRLLGDGWADPVEMTPEAARLLSAQQCAWLAGAPAPMAAVSDVVLPGSDGDVPARVYRPSEGPAPGILVWLHGGGFVIGSLDQSDVLVRALAAASGCVTVSVDYRLAPEHRFPAGLEDCYAAVRWLAEHGEQVGAPGAGVAVAGDSAGGCLTAGVALLARERGGPPIALQALVYPMTWRRPEGVAWSADREIEYPPIEALRWNWGQYADPANPMDPRMSPLLAESLDGLPPTLMITAEYDTLREEAERYATRLIEAGVPIDVRRYDGMLHGFLDFNGVPELAAVAAEAIGWIGKAVREALAVELPVPA